MKQDIAINENLKVGANQAVVKANAMTVTDNPSNEEATNFLKTLKKFQSEIKAELRPAIEKAFDLHKTLVKQEKSFLAPLQTAESAIKSKISTFLAEQEKIRQEEQRKAREKAEAEERRAREEKERQQREWEAKEKAKREEAEKLAAEGKEEEARKARLAADKAAEKAEEREQQAAEVHVPAPIVDSKVEQQKGISAKVNWKFEIVDEEKVPNEWKIVDEPAIGKIVRGIGNKDRVEKMIPGIRVWSESTVSVRA